MMPSLPPNRILPDAANTALLIIDVQERLCAAMPANVTLQVTRSAGVLIETAREFNLPILVSEQYPGGLGPTLVDLRARLPHGVLPQEKVAFSCCAAPTMQPLIENLAGRSFILCGIETHVCVLQTALDLLSRGQTVYIAADATCSRTKTNWRLGLELLRQAGAVIASTEILMFGLLRAAGTDQFKRLSKLVK